MKFLFFFVTGEFTKSDARCLYVSKNDKFLKKCVNLRKFINLDDSGSGIF